MFVSSDCSGFSTISFTPTAAARCTTTSARPASWATSGWFSTVPSRSSEPLVVKQVAHVVDGARGDVVERDDGVAACQQDVREVGADEPGAAGDEVVHGRWLQPKGRSDRADRQRPAFRVAALDACDDAVGAGEGWMRVVIVTGIFPPDIGGPATHASDLRDALVERGHRVVV